MEPCRESRGLPRERTPDGDWRHDDEYQGDEQEGDGVHDVNTPHINVAIAFWASGNGDTRYRRDRIDAPTRERARKPPSGSNSMYPFHRVIIHLTCGLE